MVNLKFFLYDFACYRYKLLHDVSKYLKTNFIYFERTKLPEGSQGKIILKCKFTKTIKDNIRSI